MRRGLESSVLLILLTGFASCSASPKGQDEAPPEPPRLSGIIDSHRLQAIDRNQPASPRTAFVTPDPVTQHPPSASASGGGSPASGQGAAGSGSNSASAASASQQSGQGKQSQGQGQQASGQSSAQSQGSQNGQSQSGQSASQGSQGQSQSTSSSQGAQSSSSQGSQSGQSASSSSSGANSSAGGQSSQGSQGNSPSQQGQSQSTPSQGAGNQGQQPSASSTSGVASPGAEVGQGGSANTSSNTAWQQRPELTAGGTAGAVSAESVLEALRSGSGSGHGAGTGGGGSGGGQTGDPAEASATGTNPDQTTADDAAADATNTLDKPAEGNSASGGDPQAPAGDASQAREASVTQGRPQNESPNEDSTPADETAAGADSQPKPKPEATPGDPFAGLSFPDRETPTRPRPKPRPRPQDLGPAPSPEDLEPVEPVVQQLRGTWKQVDIDADTGPDFAPAGAATRIIGIDPDRRRMLSVSGWGSPPSLVLAGEVEAGFRASGRVSIRVRDDLEGGRYPSLPAVLPAGLGAYGRPMEEAMEMRWSVADGQLTIGGRIYEPCDPAELNKLLADSGSSAGSSGPADSTSGPVVTSSLDAPAAGSTDFFGLKATGRWFCYIVDTSGSMGKGGKIDRLKEELARSINGLPSDAKFYVLFFSGGTHTLQNDWLPARSSGSFTGRLGEVGPMGGTNPREAITMALQQLDPKPDAIFFMTDGEIPGDCVGLIGQLNAVSPKVRIHTVAFGGDARGGALKTIANQNGGQFRHVP